MRWSGAAPGRRVGGGLLLAVVVVGSAHARRPRAEGPPSPAVSHALPADVVELTESCARTVDSAVWCWGESGGSHALRPMELPPVERILAMAPGVCGWRRGGLVCSPEVEGAPTGGLGLGEVWFGEDGVMFPRGHRPRDHVRVRPEAWDVVVTGCPRWDFGLVWRVGDGFETDCVDADLAPLRGATQLAGGGHQLCGVMPGGTVSCVDVDEGMGLSEDVVVEGITDAVEVAVGSELACVRHGDGAVSCFGYDRYLEDLFGDVLTHVGSPHPPVDTGIRGATALWMGHRALCVAQGPTVQCFQPRLSGAEQPVAGLPPVVDAGVHDGGGCGLARDHAVWCWEESTAWEPVDTGLRARALAGPYALDAAGDLRQRVDGRWLLVEEQPWPGRAEATDRTTGAPSRLWARHDTACLIEVGTAACVGSLGPPSRLSEGLTRYRIDEGQLWIQDTHVPTAYAGRDRWTRLAVEGGRPGGAPAVERVAGPPPAASRDWPVVAGNVELVSVSGTHAWDARGRAFRLSDRGTTLALDPDGPPQPARPVRSVATDGARAWTCRLDGGSVRCAGVLHDGGRPALPGLPPPEWVGMDELTLDLPPMAGIAPHPWRELVLLGEDGRVYVPLGSEAPAPVAGLPPATQLAQVATGRTGGCARETSGGLWCWGTGAPRRVAEDVVAVGGGSAVLWIDGAGRLVLWSGSRGLEVAPDLWPGAPAGLELRGDQSRGCAYVPGGARRCWGERPPPPGPIEDWTVALVVHSERGLLDARRDWAPLALPPGPVDLLEAGPRVRVGDAVLLCSGERCVEEVRVPGIVAAQGGLLLDSQGQAWDHEGWPVVDGVERLGDGIATVLRADGSTWVVGAPGHGGWRPVAAREGP